MEKLYPFTKWVGGKRQLLPELLNFVPTEFNTYFEPFIGGGALFLELSPKKAVINDLNTDLVLTYRVVKDNVEELIQLLREHQKKNSKEYYLALRAVDRDGSIEKFSDTQRAARLLYMLRVNFNGLYRVNAKNQFNVPYGKYVNPKILDEALLRGVSNYLNSNDIQVLNGDFTEAVHRAKKGDFVYFDPPYVPLSETSAFTSYTSQGFTFFDQERLFNLFEELHQKGVKVMLSNSDSEVVRNLYKQYRISVVSANRMINSNTTGRGKITELIITNY